MTTEERATVWNGCMGDDGFVYLRATDIITSLKQSITHYSALWDEMPDEIEDAETALDVAAIGSVIDVLTLECDAIEVACMDFYTDELAQSEGPGDEHPGVDAACEGGYPA